MLVSRANLRGRGWIGMFQISPASFTRTRSPFFQAGNGDNHGHNSHGNQGEKKDRQKINFVLLLISTIL
jgi:hypothetical protein